MLFLLSEASGLRADFCQDSQHPYEQRQGLLSFLQGPHIVKEIKNSICAVFLAVFCDVASILTIEYQNLCSFSKNAHLVALRNADLVIFQMRISSSNYTVPILQFSVRLEVRPISMPAGVTDQRGRPRLPVFTGISLRLYLCLYPWSVLYRRTQKQIDTQILSR